MTASGEDDTFVLAFKDAVQTGTWQFNEAVSLLREARQYLPEAIGLAEEIDDSIDAIQAALEGLAAIHFGGPSDG